MKHARKQNLIYGCLMLIVSILTYFGYRYVNEGWIYFRQGEDYFYEREYVKAIPYYQKSLAKGIHSSDLTLHLATAYFVKGSFHEAIALYRDYLSTHPKDKRAHLEYARALEWSGDTKGAEAEFIKILETNYDH